MKRNRSANDREGVRPSEFGIGSLNFVGNSEAVNPGIGAKLGASVGRVFAGGQGG